MWKRRPPLTWLAAGYFGIEQEQSLEEFYAEMTGGGLPGA